MDTISASSPDFVIWPTPESVDATVSDAQAASGVNSLALPGGQSIDILYNLGDQYTEGSFIYSMDVLGYTTCGSAGYNDFT